MKYRIAILTYFIIISLTNHVFSKTYTDILNDIKTEQINFQKVYQNSNSTVKDSLITEAKSYITEKLIYEIFPAWYGTPWDFYGTTNTPQKGKIACGYFVTTTLVHAGFNIPRYKWAQLSAENIIKKFTSSKEILRMSNITIDSVKTIIQRKGISLYIVGLDCHVGFIYNSGKEIFFIHSNYYKPEIGAMSESIYTENPLKHSGYRVIGKLFDKKMIEAWILNQKFIGY